MFPIHRSRPICLVPALAERSPQPAAPNPFAAPSLRFLLGLPTARAIALELEILIASWLKCSQAWQRHPLALPNASKQIVYDAVHVIGGRSRTDAGFLRQPPRQMFFAHAIKS